MKAQYQINQVTEMVDPNQVKQMSESEFSLFFKNKLEDHTGLNFNECELMSGGIAVFGSEKAIKELENDRTLPTRDLDFDEDYGWSVVIVSK